MISKTPQREAKR